MQRDYILRLIEQVGQLLSRAVGQRTRLSPHEALQSIMAAFERLFGMEAVQIFRFTPDQHIEMLAEDETAEGAQHKILMYAALNEEAGRCYITLEQPELAQQSFLNALRLSLKAQLQYPGAELPDFAPPPSRLLEELKDVPLDTETSALLARAGYKSDAAESEPLF
jgi:hypothetical protein